MIDDNLSDFELRTSPIDWLTSLTCDQGASLVSKPSLRRGDLKFDFLFTRVQAQ